MFLWPGLHGCLSMMWNWGVELSFFWQPSLSCTNFHNFTRKKFANTEKTQNKTKKKKHLSGHLSVCIPFSYLWCVIKVVSCHLPDNNQSLPWFYLSPPPSHVLVLFLLRFVYVYVCIYVCVCIVYMCVYAYMCVYGVYVCVCQWQVVSCNLP